MGVPKAIWQKGWAEFGDLCCVVSAIRWTLRLTCGEFLDIQRESGVASCGSNIWELGVPAKEVPCHVPAVILLEQELNA